MKPFDLNLLAYSGATFRKQITWKTGTPALPVNLTGCTARMQLRLAYGSAVLAELTTANGGIVLGTTDGKISLYIDATTTATFTWLNAIYDLEIQFGNTDVIKLLKGKITTEREVTRV